MDEFMRSEYDCIMVQEPRYKIDKQNSGSYNWESLCKMKKMTAGIGGGCLVQDKPQPKPERASQARSLLLSHPPTTFVGWCIKIKLEILGQPRFGHCTKFCSFYFLMASLSAKLDKAKYL